MSIKGFYVITGADLDSLVQAVRRLTLSKIVVNSAKCITLGHGDEDIRAYATALFCEGTEEEYQSAKDIMPGAIVIKKD